jgi:hypothetical protein
MQYFKRNQIEDAIHSVVGGSQVREPPQELRNRIKRLLDTDRAAGRLVRANDPERTNYAFYSDASPGSGVEVRFTQYEAFAVQMGLTFLSHGWPQGFVVSLLRRARPKLEKAYAEMMTWNRQDLLGKTLSGTGIDPVMPMVLVVVSRPGFEQPDFAVRKGSKRAMDFLTAENRKGGVGTLFELARTAHGLANKLAQTEPNRRGRT